MRSPNWKSTTLLQRRLPRHPYYGAARSRDVGSCDPAISEILCGRRLDHIGRGRGTAGSHVAQHLVDYRPQHERADGGVGQEYSSRDCRQNEGSGGIGWNFYLHHALFAPGRSAATNALILKDTSEIPTVNKLSATFAVLLVSSCANAIRE